MQRQRPTGVIVCGILNIVFGGMGLAYLVCAGVVLFVVFSVIQNTPELQELVDMARAFADIPGYVPFVIASGVLSLIFLSLLLAAGFGLLKMRAWGRWLSIVYGVYSVLMTLVSVTYSVLVVNPALAEWQQRHMGGKNPFAGSTAFGNVGAVAGSVFSLIYPVVLLIIMFRPSVVAAFRPPAEAMDVELAEGEEEQAEGEPWR